MCHHLQSMHITVANPKDLGLFVTRKWRPKAASYINTMDFTASQFIVSPSAMQVIPLKQYCGHNRKTVLPRIYEFIKDIVSFVVWFSTKSLLRDVRACTRWESSQGRMRCVFQHSHLAPNGNKGGKGWAPDLPQTQPKRLVKYAGSQH